MSPVPAALRAAVTHLTSFDIPFALIGGFAVSAYAEPRITRDVDFAVAVESDAEAESIAFRMRGLGYEIATSLDHVPTGRLGTVRLQAPGPFPVLPDLLFASSGIEREIVRAAKTRLILPDLSAPVAAPGHLVALKLLARDDQRRPQDLIDLVALRPVLTDGDADQARAAAALIVARGFARERDLPQLLEDYLRG